MHRKAVREATGAFLRSVLPAGPFLEGKERSHCGREDAYTCSRIRRHSVTYSRAHHFTEEWHQSPRLREDNRCTRTCKLTQRLKPCFQRSVLSYTRLTEPCWQRGCEELRPYAKSQKEAQQAEQKEAEKLCRRVQ